MSRGKIQIQIPSFCKSILSNHYKLFSLQFNIMEQSRGMNRPKNSGFVLSALGTTFVLILSFYLVSFQPVQAGKLSENEKLRFDT